MFKNNPRNVNTKTLAAAALSLPLSLAGTSVIADSDTFTLEEIVVTAQKRTESLQSTAMSVDAFSGSVLSSSGVTDTSQLAEISPNVTMLSTRPSQSKPYIRGVGSPIDGPGVDQGVAVYLDGVQVDSSASTLFSLLDIAQVEVLKGPQGTLYGRNALGGVINITSTEPSEEFQGSLNAGIGRFGQNEVGLSIEGGITDTLKGRLSGSYTSRDSYIDNDAPGFDDLGESDRSTVRGKLIFSPTDELDITLSADLSESNSTGPAYQPISTVTGQGVAAVLSGLVVPTYNETDGNIRKLQSNVDGSSDTDGSGASLTINYTLSDKWEFTSITGYRESSLTGLEDLDASALDYLHVATDNKGDNTSQEIRFDMTSDTLTGVIGFIYSESSVDNLFSVKSFYEFAEPLANLGDPNAGAAPTITNRGSETRSMGIFTQWDINLTEEFTLTLGGRYGKSDKTSYRDSFNYFDSYFANQAAGRDSCFVLEAGAGPEAQQACTQIGGTSQKASDQWSKFTPKVGLSYAASDDLMIYASFSQGYRDGGFSGTDSNLSGFDEETLNAYELGIKSEWLDNRLRVNGAIFYYDYEDMQMEISNLTSGGQLLTKVNNAGKAALQGAEIETTWMMNETFSLSFNLGLLDTEITELKQSPGVDFGFIREGNEFNNAPDVTASIIPTFNFDFDAGNLTWRTELNYKSGFYDDFENGGYAGTDAGTLTGINIVNGIAPADAVVNPNDLVDDEKTDSRLIVNSSLHFTDAEDRFEVTLWARNLLDEEYETQARYISGVVMSARIYGEPRTFGIKGKYKF